jgi:hypothetical protein
VEPTVIAALSPTVDGTDPLVVGIAWALTWALGRWAPGLRDRYRGALPVVAVLLAVGARAALDAAAGDPLTLDTLARALAAGAVAGAGHSQVREVQKALVKAPADDAPVDGGDG